MYGVPKLFENLVRKSINPTDCHAGGREFESRRPRKIKKSPWWGFLFYVKILNVESLPTYLAFAKIAYII